MNKKIKLVVSDLHLGLGRTLKDGRINSLEEFYFDEKFAEFLQFYTTGKYADYDVEVILNGDVFNFLQVDYRGHFVTVITEPMTVENARGIVEGHPVFFKSLRDFTAKEGRTVTYIVGNHDQGMLWPGVRAYFNEVLQTNIKYKNIVYYFDGVHIEHGNMHEAANRLDPRKFFLRKNLPEPILNLPFGSFFFLEFVLKVKQEYPHVDKIRPLSAMMRWALLHQTWFTIKTYASLVRFFFRKAFTKDPHRSWSIKSIIRIMLESAVFPDLGEAARRILIDERVHTVIFGHTHSYQYRQWGADMEYFNTGTWTELTSLDIGTLGRITKLTYVLLEYSEDGVARPRGRLKEWHGFHRIEEDVAIS